jgi:IrrE N-terminal-like domain
VTRSKNRYINAICERSGEKNVHRAISHLVDEYRRNGENLERVAERLGVTGIFKERLPFEGGVFCDNGALTIKLNSLSPLTRQRFTLAHELAHLILDPQRAGSARRCVVSSALEKACDAVAGELLMPVDEARALTVAGGSVDALVSLARHFNVSLQAAAVRVREVAHWKDSIGFWKWNKCAIELWFVGKRCWPERHVNMNVFDLAMRTSTTIKARECCHDLGRGAYFVSLEVRRLGKEYLLGLVRA